MLSNITRNDNLSDNKNYKLIFFIIALCVAELLYGISIGMNLVLIPMELYDYGLTKIEISKILAMEMVAILVTAPFLPILTRKIGLYRLIIIGLIIRNVFLLQLGFIDHKYAWMACLFIHGAAGFTVFMSIQVWVNKVTDSKNRAISFGALNAALISGIALGPFILQYSELWNNFNFIISAGICSLALFPILLISKSAPISEAPAKMDFMALFDKAQTAILCGFTFDFIYVSLSNFIVIYGISHGLSRVDASLVISYMVIAGIIMNVPVGWVIDRVSRKIMIPIFTVITLISIQFLSYAIGDNMKIFSLCLLLSASISGIYICGLSILGDKFKGSDLIMANSALSVMNALGGVAGLTATGIAIDKWGDNGLVISISIICIIFLLYIALSFAKNQIIKLND